MQDAQQALMPPPKVPFGGPLAQRLAPLVEPLLKPAYGLVFMVALFCAALKLGKGYPAVELGAGADYFPGHLYAAKIGYLFIALALVWASRSFLKYRDVIAAVTGLTLDSFVFGWRATLLLAVWLLVAHFALKRLPQHASLVLVGVGIVLGVKRLPPPVFWGNNFFLALSGLRVAYYAFDRRYLRARDVSIVRAFNYCFTPLLFLGPDLIAYPSFFRQEPLEKTNRNAARLFYWAGIKLLLLAVLLVIQHIILPDPVHFDDLSAPWKWFVFFNELVSVFWLRVFVSYDVAAAFANFAGYPVPDPNEAPFFGPTPFNFFRRHNVNVLNFYRRVGLLEVTRRVRGGIGFVLVILTAIVINLCHHMFIFSLLRPQRPEIQNIVLIAPQMFLLFLLAGYIMEEAYVRFWPIARYLFLPATLFVMAVGSFNLASPWFGYGKLTQAVTPARMDCFFHSLLMGGHCADVTTPLPLYVKVLAAPVVFLGATAIVILLGKLVPAFRAPVDTRVLPGRKRATIEFF